MKKMMLFAVLSVMSMTFGEVLWEVKTIRDFENHRPLAAREDGSYLTKKMCWAVSKKMFPADAKKRYRISCDIRAVSDKAAQAVIRVGVTSRDVKKRPAVVSGVMPVKGTETEVVAPVAKTDKVIMVKNASQWKNFAARIVYDADPTGQMRDIPNFDFVSGRPVKYTQKGDVWEITLNRPANVELAAGTVIRQHSDARNAIFSNAKKISKEWKNYEFVIQPGLTMNGTTSNKLFPGVAFISPMLTLPAEVEIRNFKFEVVE